MATPLYLEKVNAHPRDSLIFFDEGPHTYQVGSEFYKSMTTIIHDQFNEFDADAVIQNMKRSKNWPNSPYFGQTDEQIKKTWKENGENAANEGTIMHAAIELYINQINEGVTPTIPETTEFSYFLRFYADFKRMFPTFRDYRTEWRLWDEDALIAGTIDFAMINDQGQIIILDWKRSKEIKKENRWQKGKGPFKSFDDCNHNHYLMQLNGYAHVLKTKYQMDVVGLFLAIFHPNNESYQCLQLSFVQDRIEELWNLRKEEVLAHRLKQIIRVTPTIEIPRIWENSDGTIAIANPSDRNSQENQQVEESKSCKRTREGEVVVSFT